MGVSLAVDGDKAVVAVTRVEIRPDGKSTVSVRIRGRMEHGWNYASTPPLAMAPGKLYRLSVCGFQWIASIPAHRRRISSASSQPPLPIAQLGQCISHRYDTSRLGMRQCLVGEFRSPEETKTAWLALEKGDRQTKRDRCLPRRCSAGDHLAIRLLRHVSSESNPGVVGETAGRRSPDVPVQGTDRGTSSSNQDHARYRVEEGPR